MNENDRSTSQEQLEEQSVRELLHEAGTRPPLPAADLAIIKAAARHEWEQLQAAREDHPKSWSGRRLLAWAAVLTVVVLAGWLWTQGGGRPAVVVAATVEVSGHASPEWSVGSAIPAGARIDTPSPMALRLVGGRSLRIASNSSVEVVSSSLLRLRRGAAYVDSDPSATGRPVRIRTEHGVVREVGTQFEVRLAADGSPLRVRVREGEVVLQTNGESSAALAGEQLSLQDDGSVRRERVALFGEPWEWAESLAPPFALNESSFGEYLEWLARETGWQIQFEDDDLRQTAFEIVLYGSLEDASPSESVDVAFPMTGLSYRRDEGRLQVLRN